MIHLDGPRFRDEAGRHMLLRGVNFGGDCKVPFAPDGQTWRADDFSNHRTVSFVGRPAPLDEIDRHLARISGWGFNCLRLLTTWEAVEHAGPGIYDEAYLDYFAEVSRRAGAHGLALFVDFHQDVWSRMTGGDGAPGWTFEAAGLDFTRFSAAGAAHVMQHRYDPLLGGRQESYPAMSWGANYRMPATGIMWTLFFAGDRFAPGARVGGESVQAHLRRHYLGAMAAVAERLADQRHVIGFDTLNEPGSGFIGRPMSERHGLLKGLAWSPLDALAVASGMTRELPELGSPGGSATVNPDRLSIWLDGREDPFRAAGAWDVDAAGEPAAIAEDFFQSVDGAPVDHGRDHMAPFFAEVAATVRSIRDDWLVFAEVDPFAALSGHGFPAGCPDRTVNASHWYDLHALVTKSFDGQRSVDLLRGRELVGERVIEDAYAGQLGMIKAIGDALPGGAPTLIGEFGIPYDLNDAASYRRWADGERSPEVWAAQAKALDLMYNALDRHLLSSTQWNYTVSNRNDLMIGDGWNQEDLSIWSSDQCADGNDGGRAVEGFCRPFVRAAQGTLLSQSFDRGCGLFEATIDVDPKAGPTELFIPPTWPRALVDITANGAEWGWDRKVVTLTWAEGGTKQLRVVKRRTV